MFKLRVERKISAIRLGAMVLGGVLGLLVFAQPVAAAEDLNILIDRVQRLERDIQGLSRSVYRDKQAPVVSIDTPGGVVSTPQNSAYTARLSVRINELDEQIRALTGAMETVSHSVSSLNERLNKLVGDIDFRLSSIEHANRGNTGEPSVSTAPGTTAVESAPSSGAGQATSRVVISSTPGVLGTVSEKDMYGNTQTAPTSAETSTPVQTTTTTALQPAQPAPAGILPEGTAKDRYQFATKKLFKGDYAGAEQAFTEFLLAHGDDPLAGNARYWLGETHYVRKDYPRAAQIFLEGYQRDPKGTKAADSLLKLGMSLRSMDKPREACASFKKLLTEYENAAAPIKKVAVREKTKLGCK